MSSSTLPFEPDGFCGTKLGSYELICRLSTGGMSEIFLASQRGTAGFRKLFVVKRILPDISAHEEFVGLFLDEARITAQFTHPNIAHVFDLDVADGQLFLAMEFVHGATLVEVARACREQRQTIPVGFTLAVIRDTALALHYAHSFVDPAGQPRSVIHRDVAEKNIMVTYEGMTKLLDFGIAKQLGQGGRTGAGMVRGTAGYMSPEQVLGEEVDARTDIFSLGIVAHQFLCGQRLFRGATPREEMVAPLTHEAARPSARNPNVPAGIDDVVLRALAKERRSRFSSALEFARALERAAGDHLWKAEQCGALVRNFFAERRQQIQKLYSETGDVTAEITTVEEVAARLHGNAGPRPGFLHAVELAHPSDPTSFPVNDVTPRQEIPTHSGVAPVPASAGSSDALSNAPRALELEPRTLAEPVHLQGGLGTDPDRTAAFSSPPEQARAVPAPAKEAEPATLRPGQVFITPQPMLDPAKVDRKKLLEQLSSTVIDKPGAGPPAVGADADDPEPFARQAEPQLAPEPVTLSERKPTTGESFVAFEPRTVVARGRPAAEEFEIDEVGAVDGSEQLDDDEGLPPYRSPARRVWIALLLLLSAGAVAYYLFYSAN